jgi:hypothetical protein
MLEKRTFLLLPIILAISAAMKGCSTSEEAVFPGAGGAYGSKIPDGYNVYVTFVSYPKKTQDLARLERERALARTFQRFNEGVGRNAYGYWVGPYNKDRASGTFDPLGAQRILGLFAQKLEDGPYLLFSVEPPNKVTVTSKTYAIDLEWANPKDIEDYVLMLQQIFRVGPLSVENSVNQVQYQKYLDIVADFAKNKFDRLLAVIEILNKVKAALKPKAIEGRLLDFHNR